MLQLFVPSSKVQKDRKIMRETDTRMAKYSRRGLVLNFIVGGSCLTLGGFFDKHQQLALALAISLLLVTLLRAYYLFRFDTLYARGPARWRNQYFVVSFLGAAVWSCILVSLTWVQGMRDETLILWLYSVVFYSSVANVFAPFQRFLSIYLFIGQVPAALTAILLVHGDGYLYGSIMLMFFLMLNHQSKVTSENFWERLEAHYALRERAKGLEYEQRSSRAAIELKNEFLVNLGQELRGSLNDILATLALVDDDKLSERHRELLTLASKAAERQLDLVNNVVDFSKITTKSLELEDTPFNLRRLLEKLVQDFAFEAHQQEVELNYLFDEELPHRVQGDATRLGQILSTLMTHAVKHSGMEQVLVEAVFHPDKDENGELQLIISDSSRSASRFKDQGQAEEQPLTGIGLSICKGLAECMNGSVHLVDNAQTGKRIVINVPLEVIAYRTKGDQKDKRLRDKRILLMNVPEVVALDLVDQINAWGADATRAYTEAKGLELLKAAAEEGKAYDLVLIDNKLGNLGALAVSRNLAADPQLESLKQVIAISGMQREASEVKSHLETYPQVSLLEKPIMRRKLYEAFTQRFSSNGGAEQGEPERAIKPKARERRRVLLVEDQRVTQMVVSGMLKKLGCQVQVAGDGKEALSALEKEHFDLVLMDCDMPELDGLEATKRIRQRESDTSATHLPIVAMTSYSDTEDKARCRAAGMDDHVAKPMRYEDLEARLETWLAAGTG